MVEIRPLYEVLAEMCQRADCPADNKCPFKDEIYCFQVTPENWKQVL